MSTNAEPHYLKHRERLKKRFQKSGRDGLADYEMLELLLTYSIPRRDVKPLAKELLKKAGSFRNVFDLPADELQKIPGIGEHTAILIKLCKHSLLQYFEPDEQEKVILSSPEAVFTFLQQEMTDYSEKELHSYLKGLIGNQAREFFMILCLNSANQLIHKQLLFAGTLDQAQVYPREIIKIALFKNASALILVHNHPSGNSKPSEDDLQITRRLENISSEFGIRIHDHLIITGDSVFSIKANRLL